MTGPEDLPRGIRFRSAAPAADVVGFQPLGKRKSAKGNGGEESGHLLLSTSREPGPRRPLLVERKRRASDPLWQEVAALQVKVRANFELALAAAKAVQLVLVTEPAPSPPKPRKGKAT